MVKRMNQIMRGKELYNGFSGEISFLEASTLGPVTLVEYKKSTTVVAPDLWFCNARLMSYFNMDLIISLPPRISMTLKIKDGSLRHEYIHDTFPSVFMIYETLDLLLFNTNHTPDDILTLAKMIQPVLNEKAYAYYGLSYTAQ